MLPSVVDDGCVGNQQCEHQQSEQDGFNEEKGEYNLQRCGGRHDDLVTAACEQLVDNEGAATSLVAFEFCGEGFVVLSAAVHAQRHTTASAYEQLQAQLREALCERDMAVAALNERPDDMQIKELLKQCYQQTQLEVQAQWKAKLQEVQSQVEEMSKRVGAQTQGKQQKQVRFKNR